MYSEPKNDLEKTVWPKFEVTDEVTDEKNRKKSSVFRGFRRQGVKNTVSRLPVALRSSASADPFSQLIKNAARLGGIFCSSFENSTPRFRSVLLTAPAYDTLKRT